MEKMKSDRGEKLHYNYIERRNTFKWLKENEEGHISYEKMELAVN